MIRFYNGKILHFNPDPVLSDDELWVDGDIISYFGPEKNDSPSFERQINLNGNILMPGFKDAHTHTAMTFLRSYAENKSLHDWLTTQIFPAEAKLTPDAVYSFTKLGIAEYLTSGITSSFDMYYYNDSNVQANIDSGFRTVLVSAANNYDKDITNVEREYVKFNSFNPLVSYIIGMHAEYTTCKDRIEYLVSLGRKYKSPMFTHISETKFEVRTCIERNGMPPALYLDSLGFFDYGGGGYHCVYLTKEEIELFRRKNLTVVTNPCSNLKLASGIAPIARYLKSGVNVAIGTDGAASNNALDFFREMYLVSVLSKYKTGKAYSCPASEVLKMACVNGANAMNLPQCNNIQVGKQADLIVIDMSQPNMQPVINPVENLVYSGSKTNVLLTMVAGRILYEKGEFYIGEDVENLYRKCQDFVNSL